ncbi:MULTISPECIES: ATP-binding protein [unclassified Streptomyces]|uniref:ATP-binding protein n=1 Tax=unclassified Streptomyces TaxID=2593676 RepID=UPI00382978AE
MSLPVTRRIARAALLVAAGAAPVVAAAGSAEAATLPKAPDMGLSAPDSAGAAQVLASTAKTGAGLLNEVGKQTATTVAPTVAKAAAKAAPLAQSGAKQAKDAAQKVAKQGASAKKLPSAAQGALGLLGGLPIGG